MNCVSYSNDGQFIATGGQDSKVKVWSTATGFCFVTFTEHEGPVTSLVFASKKQVLFSASLDGTVRAFDLIRYRNFKTFTSPLPEQFSCLAVDSSAEIVCAGSLDSFEIYMWSVQTGQLLEIISGHQGPISSLMFSPTTGHLASGSWDKTIQIRDVFSRDSAPEVYHHASEVLSFAFSPDGKTIASTSMNGKVSIWIIELGSLKTEISCSRDITPGRKMTDLTKPTNGKFFSTISFTVDGGAMICGGNSPHLCIYDLDSLNLIKKFTITKNTAIDGVKVELNSKDMTEAGPISLIDIDAENSDLEDRIDRKLPGVQSGDASLRTTRPSPRTSCVRFSPCGSSFSCSTTEGLFIYSLNHSINFDPFDLEVDITPASCTKTSNEGLYLKALCMSFRLGEPEIISYVFERVPFIDIPHVVQKLPTKYIEKLLIYLSRTGQTRVSFVLKWTRNLFKFHANTIKSHHLQYNSHLIALHKSISKSYNDTSRV
jgi:periodic tryptophan protein 2